MRTQSPVCWAALLLLSAWTSGIAEEAPAVVDSSFVLADGSRVLQQSIEVPASRDDVWQAFTTAEGLMSWAVPFAVVDFRLGGSWETSYQPDARPGDPANIRSRIISFLPLSMLSIQAVQAPPDFPRPELLRDMFAVFRFESVDDAHTRISVSGIGYGAGPEFDELYETFRKANGWTLLRLHARFKDGPVEWDRAHPTINNKE